MRITYSPFGFSVVAGGLATTSVVGTSDSAPFSCVHLKTRIWTKNVFDGVESGPF